MEFRLKEAGTAPVRTEGFHTNNWFILDYGSVIVHVFSPEARDFYDLEHLWADGEDVTPRSKKSNVCRRAPRVRPRRRF